MAITDNLQAWWDYEEASGTRYDETSNNNDLDQVGSGYNQVTGKLGCGAEGTISSRGLAINWGDQTNLALTGDQTWAGWVRFDAGSSGYWFARFGQNAIFFDNAQQEIVWSTWGTSSVRDDFSTNFYITDATWTFIVATYTQSTKTKVIYKNDSVSDSHVAIHTNAIKSVAGAMNVPYTSPGNQAVDAVGIWTRVLTAAERTFLYNGGTGRSYDDILAVEIPGAIQGPNPTAAGATGRVYEIAGTPSGPSATVATAMAREAAPVLRGRMVFPRMHIERYHDKEDFEPERLDW